MIASGDTEAPNTETKPIATSWHGSLTLDYLYRDNATLVGSSRLQAPLKVQRPFYPEGAQVCHTVILHTAGGIVGGDRLSLNFHLRPQAQVLITTAAASKVYRSNGQTAQQVIQITVEPGACLEWLPQEAIVFNQAAYTQTLRVDLAPGGSWLGWDITRFGRTARGERFVAGHWRSATEVWQQGRPLWIDRQAIQGSEAQCSSPHGLANAPVVGSFVWLGSPVSPELIEQARSLWQAGGYSGEAGVTRLQQGFLCRYRGHSSSEARHWFIQVWQLVRLIDRGRDLCLPRVWGL